MFSKILLASDGSADAAKAAKAAASLAGKFGAELLVLHAFPLLGGTSAATTLAPRGLAGGVDPKIIERWAASSQEVVSQRVTQALEETGALYTFRQVNGDPADTIVRVAEEEGSDLIVVGSRGLGETLRFLLGSVSDRVSHHAPCSVLIVR